MTISLIFLALLAADQHAAPATDYVLVDNVCEARTVNAETGETVVAKFAKGEEGYELCAGDKPAAPKGPNAGTAAVTGVGVVAGGAVIAAIANGDDDSVSN